MMPAAHTLYSLALFLALASLLGWSHRRHRVERLYRAGVSAFIADEESSGTE